MEENLKLNIQNEISFGPIIHPSNPPQEKPNLFPGKLVKRNKNLIIKKNSEELRRDHYKKKNSSTRETDSAA